MRFREIRPAHRPLDAVVRLPGSKSITNRALILAALGHGRSVLSGALFSDDTELMMAGLQVLGVKVQADVERESVAVEGCEGHLPASEVDLFCGNSGTTIRFCTALCALGGGEYRMDGVERMRQRPIAQLVDALRMAGARVEYEEAEGYPPVVVRGAGLRGGAIVFDAPVSSQFVSAVMMVSPYARGDVFFELQRLVSVPYITMTARMMEAFGAAIVEKVEGRSAKFIVPAHQHYLGREYQVEPDASSASYFLAAAAVAGGHVVVEGLGRDSLQGDIRFADVLARMGCHVEWEPHRLRIQGPPSGTKLTGIDIDLKDMPDVAPTLSVVALFADGPTNIRNVANLRVKESDRLSALASELSKFGAEVEIREDGLTIHPPGKVSPARVATFGDHRMAMSFAVAGLVVDGTEILDPTCVNKTFPDFFERFEALTC